MLLNHEVVNSLHNFSVEASTMNCNGEGKISYADVSMVVTDCGGENLDLHRFHGSLGVKVDRINMKINDKDNTTYHIIANIIQQWTVQKCKDATVGSLRIAFKKMNLDGCNLNLALTQSEYSKYLQNRGLNPAHICNLCKVGDETILFTGSVVTQPPSRILQSEANFKIDSLLGAGGFGVVLKCRNVTKNKKRECAIKLTPANVEEGSTEVDNNRQLSNHDSIVKCYDSWINEFTEQDLEPIKALLGASVPLFMEFDGRNTICLFCISMELCGSDLRQWLKTQATVNEPVVKGIFKQIISGIQYIHKQGYIHRDIKPENIFFKKDSSTEVKIGDMGIAIEHDSVDATTSHTTGLGSTFYLAPEQRGDVYGQTVDIYAAGIILMEMMHPSIQNNKTELAAAINKLTHKGVVPSEITKNFPNHSKLIQKIVQYEEKDRPDCAKILKKIENLHKSKFPKMPFGKKRSEKSDIICEDNEEDLNDDNELIQQEDITGTPELKLKKTNKKPNGAVNTPTEQTEDSSNNKPGEQDSVEDTMPKTKDSIEPNVPVSSSTKTKNRCDDMYTYKEVQVGECNACVKQLTEKRYICSYCTSYKLCRDCFKTEAIIPEHKLFHTFHKIEPVAESSSVIVTFMRTFSTKS